MKLISRRVCLALALPVCLFWNRPVIAADAAGTAPAAPAATVVIEPAGVMDIGSVLSTEVREIKFQLVNRSDKPVKIINMRAACACTVPRAVPTDPIPPGGKVELAVQFTVAKVKAGAFERSATIELENSPVPVVTFQFKGTAVSAYLIKPGPEVTLPHVKTPDETWETKVQITGTLPNGQRLRLDKPAAGARLITELKETAPSAYELTVTPKLPQAPGAFVEELKLPVLEPAGVPPITVRFHGQVGTVLGVQGRVMHLWKGAIAKPVIRTVVLYQTPPDAVPVKGKAAREAVPAGEITVKVPPGVTAAVKEGTNSTAVRLTFAPEILVAGKPGTVDIVTKCCGTETLTYQVMTGAPPQFEE